MYFLYFYTVSYQSYWLAATLDSSIVLVTSGHMVLIFSSVGLPGDVIRCLVHLSQPTYRLGKVAGSLVLYIMSSAKILGLPLHFCRQPRTGKLLQDSDQNTHQGGRPDKKGLLTAGFETVALIANGWEHAGFPKEPSFKQASGSLGTNSPEAGTVIAVKLVAFRAPGAFCTSELISLIWWQLLPIRAERLTTPAEMTTFICMEAAYKYRLLSC